MLYLIEISFINHNSWIGKKKFPLLYLIEILHQTTTTPSLWLTSLLLYLIEILHQTTTSAYSGFAVECCILSKFYIKPQRNRRYFDKKNRCILSKFYIKPQQIWLSSKLALSCILSKFYIKPQLISSRSRFAGCCILSKFYIKPQLRLERELSYCVVSYRNSTSNHNFAPGDPTAIALYLIEILHQTTTNDWKYFCYLSCILSKFYIKPQRFLVAWMRAAVVSYRNSTSNHNVNWHHQAKNSVVSYRNSTSNHNSTDGGRSCLQVVSYRNSTSNHNFVLAITVVGAVVSYRNSTSNHNRDWPCTARRRVVSYRNSTSNHNIKVY